MKGSITWVEILLTITIAATLILLAIFLMTSHTSGPDTSTHIGGAAALLIILLLGRHRRKS